MVISFESSTGPTEVDTDKTYSFDAVGIHGWMMAAILAMLGNVGGPIVKLTEEGDE